MASCHEMKRNEVYACEQCGMELQVLKECVDVGKPAEECTCHAETQEKCEITCCGQGLVRRR
ncbi:MAG: hypothetical protein GXY33_08175 [Phycisphaerae bacterium]|nr:hypothetical protein [Phycisphaerae bacterium]